MMTISRANSIHFIKKDGLLNNAENTLSGSEKYAGNTIFSYCQKWNSADVVTVQVVSDSDTVPTVNVNPRSGAALADITATLKKPYPATATLAARYYFEFDVDFANYAARIIQIKVTQGTDIWESEYQTCYDLTDDLADGELVKIEYTNKDAISVLPNVQIDYTTGIEFFFYVEAVLKDITYQGEDEEFTNINEKVLIESQLFKARKLATIPLPEFMTDKIAIAGKSFLFVVNDLQFTTDGMPEVSAPAANMRTLTWSLIHTDILGFTNDDKSIILPSVDGMLTRNGEGIVSSWTFMVTAGYLMLAVVAGDDTGSAGDYTVNVGSTLHGVDYVDTGSVPLSGINTTFNLTTQPYFATAATVYVEITGSGAIGKMYVLLLRNTP
ncbi:MAG: hypothetical protein WC886_07335 [Saccharofermentanaceae bacterium]|jgi:hypothetical protein